MWICDQGAHGCAIRDAGAHGCEYVIRGLMDVNMRLGV